MPISLHPRPVHWTPIGAEYVRDVLPGEVVTITPENGIQSDLSLALPKEQQARCIFEYIYFARPDSHIDNVSVYASRIHGRQISGDRIPR